MQSHAPTPRDDGYERSDAALKPVVVFFVVLALVSLVAIVSMRWLFDALDRRESQRERAPHAMALDELPPAPRLQADPNAELAEYRARAVELTTRYEWIDRPAGVVRIPVQRALELLAERGLPARQ